MTDSPTDQLASLANKVDSPTIQSVIDRQAPFPQRLQKILNGAYSPNMRRSVQACVLLEADRCLRPQYKRLKAFQRKFALFDTASDIVETLTFIPPHYRIEIMYRTNTGKIMLTPDLTWRRMKLIDREIKKNITPKVKALNLSGKSHDELCNYYLQREYEQVSGKKEPHHSNWEYTHDSHFTAYRMFYLGDDVNPNLPPAIDPNPHRVVPSVKPKQEVIEAENRKRQEKAAKLALKESRDASTTSPNKKQKTSATPGFRPAARSLLTTPRAAVPSSAQYRDSEERRALLKEIKDYLEVLNEFKGIIPEIELITRKKVLFGRLPAP